MRILSGIVVLTLGLGVGCASRSDNPPATAGQGGGAATAGGAAAAGAGAQGAGAQPAARAGGAGAQAAARMTEADYDAIMKKVGPTNGAMRMKLMAGMVMEAAADGKTLGTLFGDVERFWTQYNKQDAVMWAQEARKYATEAAGAAAAGDGMKAQMAANNLLGDCKQCHGMYREMDPAGGFRMKPGTLGE